MCCGTESGPPPGEPRFARSSASYEAWSPPRGRRARSNTRSAATNSECRPIRGSTLRRLQAPCTTPRVALRAGDLEATTGAALVANAISRRPFLEGIDRDWVHRQRAQLRDIQVRSLWCRAESAFARGDHSDAIGDAQRIIAPEPFREQAYVMLMRAQVDAGNNAEALATYERLRETLASELGASPSPTTEAAFIDVLRAT
jgi:Bacterial transcriptional activator domain